MKIITKKNHVDELLTEKAKQNRFYQVAFTVMIMMLGAFMALAVKAQKSDSFYFNNVDDQSVILNGYDPVAFFTDNKPVKGTATFQFKYQDAVYYFSSQEHLDLFKSDPEKYKVQFGGWCAYAVSLGRVAPIDVNTFSIVDNRLLIQHNERAVKGWNKDVTGNLVKADKYWPMVSAKHGSQITTDEEKGFLNNVDLDALILQGYDAVAYFTDNKAIKGVPAYSARYKGATYWFVSESHANMFKEHPEMFAPQYGAFCGYAMSINKLRPINPEIFDVIDGHLILQHSKDAYDKFHNGLAANIEKANNYWPKKEKKKAGKNVAFDEAAK